MNHLEEIQNLIMNGKSKLVPAAVQQALDDGLDATAILNSMIDTMGIVGEQFKNNEIFVPEMLVAARAMKKGVAVLKPCLASGAAGAKGKVIIGTVAGDLHDIGKNLVAMMIESAGFEVIDLGVDVSADAFLEAYNQNSDAKIVALSALLTTTMPAMADTVKLFKSNGVSVKIMVGGAPITQAFADEIGADGYSTDAASAAELAKALVA